MTGQHAEVRADQTEPCAHEVMAPPSDSVQTSKDQDLHHHGSPHRTIYFMDSTSPDYGETTSNNLLYSCMHLWWYMNSTNHLLYMLLLQKPYTPVQYRRHITRCVVVYYILARSSNHGNDGTCTVAYSTNHLLLLQL